MVYVDNAEVPKHGICWFHLTADSFDELHAFAAQIGLPARAFHRGARHPHYDITAAQRSSALSGGARAVSPREIVRVARQVFTSVPSVAASERATQLALFT
ncbi:MAG: DUF4031 domain-containing protein [Proteobacteria bacterium]|nr:DUF4031 domain-containing protein [Pseudomonadota bacterium]